MTDPHIPKARNVLEAALRILDEDGAGARTDDPQGRDCSWRRSRASLRRPLRYLERYVGNRAACVREVIDSLPDSYRAALILHELEELTAEQTALICEYSVATAKIRIHAGAARLLSRQRRRVSVWV
jgi:DNA-directed RNA polymerase specialized sigma24 family protein